MAYSPVVARSWAKEESDATKYVLANLFGWADFYQTDFAVKNTTPAEEVRQLADEFRLALSRTKLGINFAHDIGKIYDGVHMTLENDADACATAHILVSKDGGDVTYVLSYAQDDEVTCKEFYDSVSGNHLMYTVNTTNISLIEPFVELAAKFSEEKGKFIEWFVDKEAKSEAESLLLEKIDASLDAMQMETSDIEDFDIYNSLLITKSSTARLAVAKLIGYYEYFRAGKLIFKTNGEICYEPAEYNYDLDQFFANIIGIAEILSLDPSNVEKCEKIIQATMDYNRECEGDYDGNDYIKAVNAIKALM